MTNGNIDDDDESSLILNKSIQVQLKNPIELPEALTINRFFSLESFVKAFF